MILENPELFRSNVQKKLEEIVYDDVIAINLEKAVFNYALEEAGYKKIMKKWQNPQFCQIYVDRLRTIYINLKNEKILEKVKNEELKPHTFVFMSHQEMNEDRWHELIEKKKILDANKNNVSTVASTDIFTCPKCKSKRCTFYTQQTRSADEAETIFVNCLDCGKNFRK